MEVDLTELLNSYEVVPVSLSDPFKSLVVDPSTMVVFRFIPIIGFIAFTNGIGMDTEQKNPSKSF